MATEDHRDITIGLEWEGMFAVRLSGAPDPDPEDGRDTFFCEPGDKGHFISAAYDELQTRLETHVAKNFVHVTDGKPTNHNEKGLFTIHDDPTLQEEKYLGEGGYAKWLNVEFSSPVYRASQDWYAEIERLFEYIRDKYRVRFNGTCALQVHVGLGRELPEKLLTLRKLGTLALLADKMLMTLYHSHRREKPWADTLCYSQLEHDPTRVEATGLDNDYKTWAAPVFETYAKDQRGKDLEYKMAKLWTATAKELEAMLKVNTGKASINFQSLSEHCTVEFRRMESTFDTKLMRSWANICIRLILYALRGDAPSAPAEDAIADFQNVLHKLVKHKLNGDNYTVWDFLHDIDCPKEDSSCLEQKCNARQQNEKAFEGKHPGLKEKGKPKHYSYIWRGDRAIPSDGEVLFFPFEPREGHL